MDPTQIKKIHAMNRYKRRQFTDNLYFYSLTSLTCCLFCCITLCLPHISSLVRVFFFVYIPSLISVPLSSKFLFITGNLIIFVLLVNSRILSSNFSSTTDVYYDEYIKRIQTQKPPMPTPGVSKTRKLEKHVEDADLMTGEDGVGLKGRGWVEEATVTEATGQGIDEDNNEDEGGELCLFSSDDDALNKRADDFIALVNRQWRLELGLMQCGSCYGTRVFSENQIKSHQWKNRKDY